MLIHGIYVGASSYEFRHIFDNLARNFRVYSLDLLGFGNSERPALRYTPAMYIQLIGDFVRQVVGGADQPVSILAPSLTAALTIRVVASSPGLFARLILIEPTGLQNLSDEYESPGRRLVRMSTLITATGRRHIQPAVLASQHSIHAPDSGLCRPQPGQRRHDRHLLHHGAPARRALSHCQLHLRLSQHLSRSGVRSAAATDSALLGKRLSPYTAGKCVLLSQRQCSCRYSNLRLRRYSTR